MQPHRQRFVLISLFNINAGWSSLVARQAHNLKVVGSNPTPATKFCQKILLLTRDQFSYML